MKLTGSIEGLDTVVARLARVAAVVEPPLLTEFLGVAAEVIAAAIRAAAPVGSADDGDKHPGLLRDSIAAYPDGAHWAVGVVGEAAVYAAVQEHGRQINASSDPFMEFLSNGVVYRAKTVHIPAHPFFYTAAESAEAPALAALEEALVRALEA